MLPVLAASPAHAAESVICVGSPVGPCSVNAASIPAAIALANGNAVDDRILVGPGSYSDGPYSLTGTSHGLVLEGSGDGTVLTLPAGASQEYVLANHATVRNLKIVLESTTSTNDYAVFAFGGAVVEDVTIDGTGTSDATGIHAANAQVVGTSIQMPLGSGSRAMYGEGSVTVLDSTLTGDTGFAHSGTGTPDTLSRTTVRTSYVGVSTDGGTVDIDDSVIDLGATGATGLMAANFNDSPTPKSINADHVTIVNGNGSSEGVWAWAARPTTVQSSTVTMTNSIVRGPAVSLIADAGNDGALGGTSTATIDVSFTDFQTTGGTIGAHGAGGVVPGAGNLNVDPAFVDAAGGDFRLSPGSPVIDRGDPAAGPPATDRAGAPRVVDGDGDGSSVRDMGAYERPDEIAPETTITGGPSGRIRDVTPTLTFTSEPGATFACKVDAGGYAPCTSPFTTPGLADGAHFVRVRATDGAGNTDGTAAQRSFTVDTVAPETTFTRKPGRQVTTRRVRFGFAAEPGATFQCRLDGGAWRACTSPRVIRVKKGRHTFAVRARDVAGNVDATPASHRFRRI